MQESSNCPRVCLNSSATALNKFSGMTKQSSFGRESSDTIYNQRKTTLTPAFKQIVLL